MLDSHCHIDLYKDPLSIASSAERAGIDVVAVTYLPSHFELARRHLAKFRFVRPALGIHPLSWKDHLSERKKFLQLCDSVQCIGEVGLDFSAGGKAGRGVQEETLSTILPRLAGGRHFVTLHSRGAETEILQHLNEHRVHPAVFHWFSGSRAQLLKVLDAGHLVSINTAMVRTTKWGDFVRLLPMDRVLTETDGPFVTTNGVADSPDSVATVLQWLANSWSCTPNAVEMQIADTYSRLLQRWGSDGGVAT